MTDQCEFCEGTGRLDVLDVWSMQRTHIEYGSVEYDSFAALPMLKQAIRCPDCCGEEACDEDMKALKERMGGCPWEEETFR